MSDPTPAAGLPSPASRRTSPPDCPGTAGEDREALYESVKGDDLQIPQLQSVPMAELMRLARSAGVAPVTGLNRQELIYQILKLKVTSRGLGWGEGVLDILPDGFGFLRSRRYDYRAGPDDVYVSPSQIRRLNLKQGHQLAGPVRPPKEGEKYFALLRVEAVNGEPVGGLEGRIPFEDLTPLLPNTRLRLEFDGCSTAIRLVDLLAPMGKGQRTLLLAPPHSGRTELLVQLADAVLRGEPDAYVILLMIDERPEEVTVAVRRTGPDERREVIASTFDEPTSHHVALARMALEKAKRMVEFGRDVVLLVDSLTALVRAYNAEIPHSGKVIAAGLDAAALLDPKRLFGAARRVEEGGSLTVIATALIDTGSRVNDLIAEEFEGKSNCEIVLDQALASTHVFPPLDVRRTGTRREDSLLGPVERERLRALRTRLGDEPSTRAALEQLIAELGLTATNAEFIAGGGSGSGARP